MNFVYSHTATMHAYTHTRKRARAHAYIVLVCEWTLLAGQCASHIVRSVAMLLPHQVRSVTLPIYGERGGFFGYKKSLRAK